MVPAFLQRDFGPQLYLEHFYASVTIAGFRISAWMGEGLPHLTFSGKP